MKHLLHIFHGLATQSELLKGSTNNLILMELPQEFLLKRFGTPQEVANVALICRN